MKYFIIVLFALAAIASAEEEGQCSKMAALSKAFGAKEVNQSELASDTMRAQVRYVFQPDCIALTSLVGVSYSDKIFDNSSSSLMMSSSVTSANMSSIFSDDDLFAEGGARREDEDFDFGFSMTSESLFVSFTHFFKWIDSDNDGTFTKNDKIVGFENIGALKFGENEVLNEEDPSLKADGEKYKPSVTKVFVVGETPLEPALEATCYFADGQGWVNRHPVSGSSSKCDLTLTNLDKLGLASNEYVGLASMVIGVNLDMTFDSSDPEDDPFSDGETNSDLTIEIDFGNTNRFEWIKECEAGGEVYEVDSLILTIEETVDMMDFTSERRRDANSEMEAELNTKLVEIGAPIGSPFKMSYFTFGTHHHPSVFWDPSVGAVDSVFSDVWESDYSSAPVLAPGVLFVAALLALLF